jgi:DeoR family transcriptional regulator, suf operon transcriptional repressor
MTTSQPPSSLSSGLSSEGTSTASAATAAAAKAAGGITVGAGSSTRQSALALLLRLGETTAAHLAGQLGVSVQITRRHLRALEEEGLVASSPAAAGPGRPTNRWHLTAEGRSLFPDGGQRYALGLLESMADTLPPETVQTLLGQQAQQKALTYRQLIGDGSLQQRLACLVDLRRREGYVAECAQEPDDGAWLFSEFHCSVMRIAERFPCVCDQELQLIRSTFPDCHVERVHWRLEQGHSCGFRLLPDHDPA